MSSLKPHRDALVLLAFAAVFVALTVRSYTTESATWDEPYHLTAGCAAARFGDYRMDPEHPPLLRMWAALPLLFRSDVKFDAGNPHWQWASFNQLSFGREFLYRDNDADGLLYRARFMTVILGLALGGLLFWWAREWFGFWPAVGALTLFSLEPNLLAHAGLVTTDLGVTLFIFGAVFFAWRVTQRFTWLNVAGLILFFALAQVSKFTALLLWPIVGLLLAWRARLRVAVLLLVTLAVTSYAAIWAAYRFRESPTPTGERFAYHEQDYVRQCVPGLAKIVERVDGWHILPNAYLEGFLIGQANAHERGAYLAGHHSLTGWWYYFPVAFLLKTPVALLFLFFAGLGVCLAQRGKFWFALVPIAIFLGISMTARLNIGLRHILPIYPFVILVATAALAQFVDARRWYWLAAVGVAAVVELAAVSPHYLAFFNGLAGGPRAGHKWLVDSNLDWGQDLKSLGAWMKKNRVPRINLSYFGSADPAYYGIDCRHLPGGPFYEVGPPELPGYIAVSVTNLRGAHFNERGRDLYAPLLQRKPVAVLGYSIHIYRVEELW